MPLRTGRAYIDALRRTPRDVWVEGSRVDDVTTHPALAANVAELARQYDKQFDPRFADSLTYVVPATGERAAASLMPAVDAAGLKRRGAAYRTQAEAALGLMPLIAFHARGRGNGPSRAVGEPQSATCRRHHAKVFPSCPDAGGFPDHFPGAARSGKAADRHRCRLAFWNSQQDAPRHGYQTGRPPQGLIPQRAWVRKST